MTVFIADDSILIRNIVEEILLSDPDIRVVGKASNGADAVYKVLALNPDIVIMDLDMPVMNGLEACSKIVEASSIPVLIFTHNTDPGLPFKALQLGAADFLLKPDFNDLNKPDYIKKFTSLLHGLSRRKNNPSKINSGALTANNSASSNTVAGSAIPPLSSFEKRIFSAVVVGASTGGPQAVSVFLSSLVKPFPLPVILVQHIETGFDKGYADWLSDETGHQVILVNEGMPVEKGKVFVARTDFHLKIKNGYFILDDGYKVVNQKPSVDVLFQSAAENYGSKVIAVLLTGMGTDGADGCVAIKEKGGYTIVQDEFTSLIFGMPKAAIAKGAASIVLPLDQIGPYINAGSAIEI